MNMEKEKEGISRRKFLAGLAISGASGYILAKSGVISVENARKLGTFLRNVKKEHEHVSRPVAPLTNQERVMFVENVNKESAWASEELNIPQWYIMAQWYMESGGFTDPSYAISFNNYGGILRNKEMVVFASPHAFARDYVRILTNDGIVNMDNFWSITNKLHENKYMGSESAWSYGNKVLNVLGMLSDAYEGTPYYETFHNAYVDAKNQRDEMASTMGLE